MYLVQTHHTTPTHTQVPWYSTVTQRKYFTDYSAPLLLINGLCTLFHIFDLFLIALSRGFYKTQVAVIHGTDKPKLVKILVFRCLVVALLVVDWVCLVCCDRFSNVFD